MSIREEIRQELNRRLETLERRQGAIRRDRQRESGPLDRDSAEQAVELENAEVLDALDSEGRAELERIRAALEQIDRPTFGICSECSESIAPGRLRAVPTATRCRGCAE